ncbi:MAG: adenylyltransferase/cytidyltransferase family protein [Candidatus Aenigmarchaeota archaeon]|nr:adenylyltransferase/cytidyltransferase family protein [Candidatus Aenigmarchaeota archaeon]
MMEGQYREVIGVYWGRFNPPHRGHLRLMQRLLREVDTLVVAVGSAEQRDTRRNPFSGPERKRMLQAYIREACLPVRRVRVVTVRDGPSLASACGTSSPPAGLSISCSRTKCPSSASRRSGCGCGASGGRERNRQRPSATPSPRMLPGSSSPGGRSRR